MCGRCANHVKALHDWEGIITDWPKDAKVGYNVAPTQTVPVFLETGGVAMRWGLIAPWAKEISSKYATFNARIETAREKPAFRHAWKQSQRCLIPAQGYYEWRTESGRKQPYFIHNADSSPVVFAGLYEPRREGGLPASCTVITRPATAEMESLHPRMPVMLQPENASDWFGESPEDAGSLADKCQPPRLNVYPVSTLVNNARNDDAKCLEVMK